MALALVPAVVSRGTTLLVVAGVVALAPVGAASAASDVTAGSAVLSVVSRAAPPLDEVRRVVSAAVPAGLVAAATG